MTKSQLIANFLSNVTMQKAEIRSAEGNTITRL
jgi:hypothetical protein